MMVAWTAEQAQPLMAQLGRRMRMEELGRRTALNSSTTHSLHFNKRENLKLL